MFTEAETLPAGVVGRVVWVPFLLNLIVWEESMSMDAFPDSGNFYVVMVIFAILTEEETLPARLVGRVVWVSFHCI